MRGLYRSKVPRVAVEKRSATNKLGADSQFNLTGVTFSRAAAATADGQTWLERERRTLTPW
jgi:hypothetical protein